MPYDQDKIQACPFCGNKELESIGNATACSDPECELHGGFFVRKKGYDE